MLQNWWFSFLIVIIDWTMFGYILLNLIYAYEYVILNTVKIEKLQTGTKWMGTAIISMKTKTHNSNSFK